MGQAQSNDHQVNNCFRNCIKQNNARSPRKTNTEFVKISKKPTTVPIMVQNSKQQQQKILNKPIQSHSQNPVETSLAHRLRMQQCESKATQSNQQGRKDILSDKLIEELDVQLQFLSATLGLQSKFECKKNKRLSSRLRNSTRVSSNCDKGTTLYQGIFNQKQAGDNLQSTTKSTKTINHTKSNKILINKIEQIKKKYYERQLQLQIYNSEKQYLQQINSIVKIENYVNQNSIMLPQQQINEISVIKGKIRNKLEQSKNKDISLDNSMYITQNINQDNILDHLQLYSKDAKIDQQNLPKLKSKLIKYKSQKGLHRYRKQEIINKSIDKSINKSINQSINKSNRSLNNSQKYQQSQNQISFSQYTQESLHQIKELDQQQEQYKSNVVKQSNKKLQLISKLQSIRQNNQSNIQIDGSHKKILSKTKNPQNFINKSQKSLLKQTSQKGMFSKPNKQEYIDSVTLPPKVSKKTQPRSSKPPYNDKPIPKNNNILLF